MKKFPVPKISNCFGVISRKFQGNFNKGFQIDVFRQNIIEILKEFGRNFEEKVGVHKMEEKKMKKKR